MKKEENILKKIFTDYVKYHGKWRVVYFLILGVITAIFMALEPLFFSKAISLLEETLKTGGEFEIGVFGGFLLLWLLFIVVSVGINFYFNYRVLEVGSLEFLGGKFRDNITKLLQVKYGDVISTEQGKLYKSFDRGIDAFFMFFYKAFNTILLAVIQIILITGIMFSIHVKMTFVALGLLPVLVILGFTVKNRTIKIQENLDTLWEKVFGKVSDSLTNAGLVKFLGLEKTFQQKLVDEYSVIEKDQKKVQLSWSFASVLTKIVILLSRLITLGFGCFYVLNGEISFAILFLFFAYCSYVYFPVGFLFDNLKSFQEDYTKIKKFYTDIESLKQDIDEESENEKIFEKVEGKLEFRNVSFGYTSDKQILNRLSFSIKKGEKVAFVGNTGAGKSTIVNLLFRLWDTDSGDIILDNNNVYDYSKQSLRKHIGLVSQDNSLFNTTIRENLDYAFGERNLTIMQKEESINDALKKAHADFVFTLKDGIDTVIGERGMKLSGGEKQRLSIARLFIKNPEILVLDEATSALDNKTEKYIQASLDTLMKGKTSIIIAHRLTTIQNADRIFMLENGEIIESGSYDELMDKKEKFYGLASPENLVVG